MARQEPDAAVGVAAAEIAVGQSNAAIQPHEKRVAVLDRLELPCYVALLLRNFRWFQAWYQIKTGFFLA